MKFSMGFHYILNPPRNIPKIGAKSDHKQKVFVLLSINNVSFVGSRKDIDLEIVWFFAYWVIVHGNTTAESMVN